MQELSCKEMHIFQWSLGQEYNGVLQNMAAVMYRPGIEQECQSTICKVLGLLVRTAEVYKSVVFA